MKKVLLICGALALSGCNAQWGQIAAGVGNVLGTANNVLADLAENSIPKACGIIRVADGYFQRLSPKISADKIAIEAKAMASVNVICNNPPKDITAAFNTLVDLWFVIQDATKTN
jgi:hypothetical protein